MSLRRKVQELELCPVWQLHSRNPDQKVPQCKSLGSHGRHLPGRTPSRAGACQGASPHARPPARIGAARAGSHDRAALALVGRQALLRGLQPVAHGVEVGPRVVAGRPAVLHQLLQLGRHLLAKPARPAAAACQRRVRALVSSTSCNASCFSSAGIPRCPTVNYTPCAPFICIVPRLRQKLWQKLEPVENI
jgi:hypothetical protein